MINKFLDSILRKLTLAILLVYWDRHITNIHSVESKDIIKVLDSIRARSY